MKTKTRIHKVEIKGGFMKSMKPSRIIILEEHSELEDIDMWDYAQAGVESYTHMRDLVDNLPQEDLINICGSVKFKTILMTVQDDFLLELITKKIPHTVEETTELEVTVATGNDSAEVFFNKTMDMMERYQEQLERLSKNTYNEKVKVHSGGIALAEYNQTMVKYDCCTDELQGHLLEGWRILSVCVQPDQRRPDYILGKVVPENEVTDMAVRY